MKTPAILAASLAASWVMTLAACSRQGNENQPVNAPPASPPAVTVNGKPISQEVFEAYAEGLARRAYEDLSAEEREQIRENLVRVELFAQDAERTGLTKDPEVLAAIEAARLQVIQQATAKRLSAAQKPTEEELRAEYDTQVANMPKVEYRARHIVLSGEDVAQKVIDRLRRGDNFAALAREMSTFKQSAANGGDLGWFAPNVMDPEFAKAVAQLKKGEVTGRPVQTRMGWQVIQLLDSRERTAPAYETVKERLAPVVMGKKLTKLSDEMLKAAKVEPPLKPDAPTDGAAPAAAPAPGVTTPQPSSGAPAPAGSN